MVEDILVIILLVVMMTAGMVLFFGGLAWLFYDGYRSMRRSRASAGQQDSSSAEVEAYWSV